MTVVVVAISLFVALVLALAWALCITAKHADEAAIRAIDKAGSGPS